MKTKLRVVLFCSLILLLLILTTLRGIWNARHSDIPLIENSVQDFNSVSKSDRKETAVRLWDLWHSWVEKDGTLFTPKQSSSHQMSELLHFLSRQAEITAVEAGKRGSQLKLSFSLAGGQLALFRPKWYSREHVIEEAGNKGADRHNGEIAAFHLSRILGMNRAPPVVGRNVNLEEIKLISEQTLADTIYRNEQTSNMCVYGVCYYCDPSQPVCAIGNTLEGSLSLMIPEKYKLRTFKHPCWNREFNCRLELLKLAPFNSSKALFDLTETSVFDFLIGNMDRHHFEMFSDNFQTNHILLLDNGKSFGNPFRDDFVLLKPLQQLCKFRNSTYQRILSVSKEDNLTKKLLYHFDKDPLSPILSREHLTAINRRLRTVIDILEYCISNHGVRVFRESGYI